MAARTPFLVEREVGLSITGLDGELFVVAVAVDAVVRDAKELIFEERGHHISRQRLILNGVILADDVRIGKMPKRQRSNLYLVLGEENPRDDRAAPEFVDNERNLTVCGLWKRRMFVGGFCCAHFL